jgi:type III pantothenate kinase
MNDKYIGAELLQINYRHLKGFKWDIDNPEEMGADRLCNVIAGYKKYGGPLIILDFGTAITFDVVDADKTYLGGAIMPGLETTMATLHAKAAKLPSVSLDFPKNVIGKNTIEHIQSGLMFGTASMVDGMVARIKKEIGEDARVIATGGLAPKIFDYTDSVEVIEKDLILDGLYYLWQMNRTDIK